MRFRTRRSVIKSMLAAGIAPSFVPAPMTSFHEQKLQRDNHENITNFSLGTISCRGIHRLDSTIVPVGKLGQDFSKEAMPDFLHPSAKGYAVWAEALKPLLP